jgi:hypothetical protein
VIEAGWNDVMEGVAGRLPSAVFKRRRGSKIVCNTLEKIVFSDNMPGKPIFKYSQHKAGEMKMKKFWIVMLAMGLFMAFTMPAFAALGGVDVQFSGDYRVRGWYDDNIGSYGDFSKDSVNKGQAFYDNRLRVETTFKIAEGLKLVTRFNALENKWGQKLNYSGDTAIPANNNNDNISFERAYVSLTTGLGALNVGYQDWQRFGTQFADSDLTFPGIKYINTFGPLTIIAGMEKISESQTRNVGSWWGSTNGNQAYNSGYVDVDTDVYDLGFIYMFKGGDAGVLYQYYHVNEFSQAATQSSLPFRMTIHLFDGYGKYKIGPFYVEAEGFMATGTYYDFGNNSNYHNVSLEAYGLYINAEVDLKPAYAGVKYAYVTGDDYNDPNKASGTVMSLLGLGQDHDFALMIGNYEYFNQITTGAGWTTPSDTIAFGGMDNINAWQIYVGVKPTSKMDVRVAVTDAYMQRIQDGVLSNHIGTEVDLRASYKIFDNLTYSVGAAYFITGDFFKGYSPSQEVTNDYLLMHQLLLSF